MFCPQCGTESSSGLQYCRQCGANLKVIGKAVTLSEAIARSDRGPLPKLKEMMKKLNVEEVSEEISTALDQMHQEMVKDSGTLIAVHKPWKLKKEKAPPTAQERREKHITHGLISLFSGIGLMVFLYFLADSLVLRVPEDIRAQAPFDIDSVVKIIWLVGLMPALTGVGRILAGLSIRPEATLRLDQPGATNELPPHYEPASVTERTTNILNRDVR